MTQQPGKGSECRKNQAQEMASFKESLHDRSKHRPKAPLAEAEETDGLGYDSLKDADERITTGQRAGNFDAHQSRPSDETNISGVDDTDLNDGAANLTESDQTVTAISAAEGESYQAQSETEQRKPSAKTPDLNAADDEDAIRMQPNITQDATADQYSHFGKYVTAEDKAEDDANQSMNGALRTQYNWKTADGQLYKSVGVKDNAPDKDTETFGGDKSAATPTDESKDIAARHSDISIGPRRKTNTVDKEKELREIREAEFKSLKLEGDVEMSAGKIRYNTGDAVVSYSSENVNERHKTSHCQGKKDDEELLNDMKSAKISNNLPPDNPNTVPGSERTSFKQPNANNVRGKIRETERSARTEDCTSTEADTTKNTGNSVEKKNADIEQEVEEITVKRSCVTVSETAMGNAASVDMNTDVAKQDGILESRTEDVQFTEETSVVMPAGKITADEMSTGLIQNDLEEANMNCEVILSENLPLIRCLKLIPIVMERFPTIKVCEDPDQIKFTSTSEEDAAAARKGLDVLVSSLNSHTESLRHPYAMLLRQNEVKTFLNKRMDEEGVQCFWLVTPDGSLKLFGVKAEMIQKARKVINESICIRKEVESAFASKLILHFSGKCQKWLAAEGETKVTILYTKDIEEEIKKMVANMTEKVRQSDSPHQISIHADMKAPDNILPEGIAHSEGLPKASCKDWSTGMSPSVESKQDRKDLHDTLSEEIKAVRKRQVSEDLEHVSLVPLEIGLIRYVMKQEEIQRIKSNFSVEINYEIGHIVINGNTDVDVSGATEALKDFAKSVKMDFSLKVDTVQEDSEEWRTLRTKAEKNNASVYMENICRRSLPDKVNFCIGNTEVKLYCGLVTDVTKVDVVVCPVNDCLVPTTPMSELIFKTGGETLYTESTAASSKFVFTNKNKHPPVGYIQFINNVGILPCSLVACIVVDDNFETIKSKLTTALSHILDKASRDGLHSVAIPIEVSKSVPVQLSTNACIEALKTAAAKHLAIPVVYLGGLIAENMKIAAAVLQTEVRKCADGNCQMVDVYSNDTGIISPQVKLEIVVGSLLDQKVDTVVCVVHKSLKLDTGEVADLILRQGGEQIQSELLQLSPVGLAEVVATNGGKLAFKRILFGSLPKMKEGNKDYVIQNIKLFLRNCFLRAKDQRCVSIAFPILGTGGLGYELEMVAREMFRAVHLYAAVNGVTHVRFVLIQQDITGQKVFGDMNKTFQQLQESIGKCPSKSTANQIRDKSTGATVDVYPLVAIGKLRIDSREDCCPYFDVKISGLDTKIIVVKNKDYEAMAADIIAESVESGHELQGSQNYSIKTKETKDELLLSDHYLLQFHASPTISDFQDCLKYFFVCFKEKNSTVSLDFTKGLDGIRNYIHETVELLRTQEETIKHMRQITIVSTEKSFMAFESAQSGIEMENKTWGLRSLLPSFLKQHKVAWYLKNFLSTRQCDPKYRCLLVVHSRDRDTLKQTMSDIDNLFKNINGSSVDGDNVEFTRSSLPSETSPVKSKNYAGRKSTGASSNRKSQAKDKENSDSTESSAISADKEPTKTDSEDEFEDVVFGNVHAVLSPNIGLKMASEDLEYKFSEIGNTKVCVSSFESKTHLNFKFSERYQVQDMMLKMNTRGLLCENRKEVIAKTDITRSGLRKYKVEDVDDSLYDLLLIYIRENVAHTSIKEEHLQREGTTVFVLTEEPVFDVVKTKLHALRGWNTETVCFGEEKRDEAIRVVSKLNDEDQNIIVKVKGKEIRIYGPSENIAPAKHKINIALGVIKPTGRKRRQFNEEFSSLQMQHLPEEKVKITSSTNVSSTEISKQYRTDEGIAVHVYKGDITCLNVDCIVNAANENLNHGGGVARAISDAAGPAFQNESNRYVTLYGQIPVTQCIETSSCDLRYKYVLHAVGPRFSRGADTSKCLDDLEETVFNAVKRADKLNMASVALPSISAGIFGGQIDDCADAYIKGVCRFSRQATRCVLKEIHFVDVQEGFVRTIQSVFDTVFQLTQAPFAESMRTNNISATDRNLESEPFQHSAAKHEKGVGQPLDSEEDPLMINKKEKSGLHGTQHSSTSYNNKALASMQPERENQNNKTPKSNLYPKLDSNETEVPLLVGSGMKYTGTASRDDTNAKTNLAATKLSDSVKENRFTDLSEYVSDKGIKIIVCRGDISLLSLDAVVCPERTNCKGVDGIARSIKSIVGNDSVWVEAKRRNPKLLSVLRISTEMGAPYNYVILVFPPRWNRELLMRSRNHKANLETYWTSIKKIILEVLEDSEQAAIRRLAFPLIGVGDDTTPYQMCCDVLCEEISKYANDKQRRSQLKEIYIVSKEEGVQFMCKEFLSKRFDADAPDITPANKHKNAVPVRSKTKTCSGCNNVAVIGVDTCNRCLETHHKETKRYINHPFCTMRYEKLNFSLQGYPNCDTIWVVYEIPDGKQREDDPQPGQRYLKCSYNAYLPANEEGWIVLKLLQKAVEKGLVFKVRKQGVVGWSGLIEHKTSWTSTRYGFPDPNYLSRVRQQLAGLGIWPDKPKTSSGTRV